MKIWTLMENTAGRGDLAAEHGLSLCIETRDHKILFDAGQTGAFADNAQRLGVDLRAVDLAVLSHGHYDHGGGLERFLELNSTAPVYLNRAAGRPHYNAAGANIGLSPALTASSRLIWTEDMQVLGKGITLHSCNGLPRQHPTDSLGLYVEKDGIPVPDDFCHEQYLLIEEDGKRVLFSGCSHKGILNIVEWFQPDVLVGGFHFVKLEPGGGRLQEAARAMLDYPTVYYTCHCTGVAQYRAMKAVMGQRLEYLAAGTLLEL